MYDIFYTEREGGKILQSRINISQERQKIWCEAQAKDIIDSYHKVILSDGNTLIKASAVFFLDGYIWDAILSGYDTMRGYRKSKRLPKCQKLPYWRNITTFYNNTKVKYAQRDRNTI